MRPRALAAAEELAGDGVDVEVIDLRTLAPWERDVVFASVRRTHRCAVLTEAVREYGPSGELAAEIAEHCFDDLDAPVVRIASPKLNAPHIVEYDRRRVPQVPEIVRRVKELL
jgi:pyruvate dehydrogenase E1 component beta subunit